MRFGIKIDYPPEKMELSRKRMQARMDFLYVDRVPVLYCAVPRFFAPLFGLRYIDFFRDVETQYYWQLQFAKYRIENIPEDFCTGNTLHVHPYFDNVIPPSGHGGEVGWLDHHPPRAIPTIKTVEQMDHFQVADPETGLRGEAIAWWQEMKELARQTKVTFNGKEGRVEVGTLSLGGLSPHMIAIDLVGQDFYWWMLEYPEACQRFLEKITQAEIDAEEHTRDIDPRPRGGYALAEDSAQIMSAELFRRFCVPCSNTLFERFGDGFRFGRAIHMCGDSTHLHKALKEDLKMNSFVIFGYLVPPKVAAANLGGTTLLWGNINPMLMKDGSYQRVKAAAWECIEEMGPCGGFMLGDGANVCPGTPLESFHAIIDAAEEFGLGDGKLPRC
jgi:uroporphyrinogen-III decarboxylase